jgi:hypothetical protein
VVKAAMMLRLPICALLIPAATVSRLYAADDSFDPVTGYRIAHYRAAVPETAPGGVRVDLDQVDKLIAASAVLLDVMPSEGAGADPATGA